MLDKLRIGTGIDAHAFDSPGTELWIGGLKIPHDRGLAGHSDADVLIHAIVDSILGALNMGDIGEHFSSSDPEWKGAPSSRFLTWTRELLKEKRAKLISIDSVLMAQEPRMKPHIQEIRANLARILDLSIDRISVKSTTTDHLGFIGRKEGMACQASCLIALE